MFFVVVCLVVSCTGSYGEENVSVDQPKVNVSHAIDCSNPLLPITLRNNENTSVEVVIGCSGKQFTHDLVAGEEVSLEAVFYEWTKPEDLYQTYKCILKELDSQKQGYSIEAKGPNSTSFKEYQSCKFSVGDETPAANHSTECQANERGFFNVNLVNDGDVWMYVKVECSNDVFDNYIPPNSNITLRAMFYDWINPILLPATDTCIFREYDWKYYYNGKYQDIELISQESDGDSKQETLGCDYSVGADVPGVNATLDCTANGDDIYPLTLTNPGDVKLFVALICWNEIKRMILQPNTTKIVNTTFLVWTDPGQTFPNDTCVLEAYFVHYQDVEVYVEESDWDFSSQYIGCNYSVGEDSPKVDHHTNCKTDEDGKFIVNIVNNGDVWVYVDVKCSNYYFEFLIPAKSTETLQAIFYDWLNPDVSPNNTCVFMDYSWDYDYEGKYQAISIRSEESDGDLIIEELGCDYSVGDDVPAITITSDCAQDEEGVFSVNIKNHGNVSTYVRLICWNDEFRMLLSANTIEIVNATFVDWANPEQVLPADICVFQDMFTSHYQEIEVYSEESDWDYHWDHIGCSYSIGADVPEVDHTVDCNASDSLTVDLVNNGDVWIYTAVLCANGWFDYLMEPHSNISLPSTFPACGETSEATPGGVCVFFDWACRYQNVEIFSEESDWDYVWTYPECRVGLLND